MKRFKPATFFHALLSAAALLQTTQSGAQDGFRIAPDQQLIDFQQVVIDTAAKAKASTVRISRSKPLFEHSTAFSGVIVSSDGLILTAAHCIRKSNQSHAVTLADGRTTKATSLGYLRQYDCALLQIDDPGPWPFSDLGWSCDLKKGQPCISLGHPAGYQPDRGTVLRFGHIVEPFTVGDGKIKDSCLMEPGDSGGPLFDLDGRVIGIHSNTNIGPDDNHEAAIDHFRLFWNALNLKVQGPLLSRAEVTTKYGLDSNPIKVDPSVQFGITWNSAIRERLGGARIASVRDGSWASKVGLRMGDEILAVGGVTTRMGQAAESCLFAALIKGTDRLVLRYVRDGKETDLDVDLSTMKLECQNELTQYERKAAGRSDFRHLSMESFGSALRSMEKQLDRVCVQVAVDKRAPEVGNEMMQLGVEINRDGPDFRVAGLLIHDDQLNLRERFSSDTFVITKRSIIEKQTPMIRLGKGKGIEARLVASDVSNDLVLLSVPGLDAHGLSVSSMMSSKKTKRRPGEFLISPQVDDSGVFSVIGTPSYRPTKSTAWGALVDKQISDRIILSKISKEGAAQRAGLEVGDQILSVDGAHVDGLDSLARAFFKKRPGDTAALTVRRDGNTLDRQFVFDARPDSKHVKCPGGISQIHHGFEQTISHDAGIVASRCGGPVFDIHGRFVGLNVARASRTNNSILPASCIAEFLKRVADGKADPE